MRSRIVALKRSERGYSIVELIVSMAILGTVMASLSALLVSATNSEVDMNQRFQAQTQARLGLDRLRREVHCAMSVAPAGASASVTLTIPATCPTAGGLTSVTWCTVANGTNRWDLWRYEGAACSGTGRKWADHLTASSIFVYTPQSTSKLATLNVRLPVNIRPADMGLLYTLDDDIVLRNSTRT
ncbi:MAG TPA: type II secretion system protein [Gaiellaceae bacterium]|nr:type II secretion system protein [Gaiellaceae bacterium]